MRQFIRVFAIVTLVGAVAHSAEKRPFTIADHYRVIGVSDPQVSPDGRRIVYVATHTELASATRWSELRMMNGDGSGDRALTVGHHLDSSPRWSPDGNAIAFVSNRTGDENQLFLLPLDGGDPRQLTSFSMGVSSPVWSPNGRFLAVASDVYPECGAVVACNAKIRRAWSEGPLQAHLTDTLLYRHWTSWRDGTFTHVLLVKLADGSLTDLTPGAFDAPVFSLGGETGYAFAPDGKELVVVSNHDPVPARSTNADLWAIPIDDGGRPGKEIDLTADNPAWDGSPAYSPDGRFIAYRTQRVPGYESDRFRIAVYDRSTGTHRVVTADFPNWIDSFAWSPDGTRLVFAAELEGRTPLFELSLASGAIRSLFTDATIDAWQLFSGGVVYTRRSVAEPSEVYRSELAGTHRTKLSHVNDALLAEVDVRPAETMWVAGPQGRRIEVFIVTPHGFDPAKKYPLILNVHGGPQSQWEDAYRGDWQVYPGAGYVVAFPNPTGSTGYGQPFTDGITRDWGGKVYEDVMAVVDALAKLPYIDASRMGAMGWSYGGYMMMWLEGHTDRFRAIASMMGVYDLRAMHSATEELWFPEHDLGGEPWNSPEYLTWSPSEFVKGFKTPCLVITGEKDFRVPYTQSLEFFTDLQEMGVPSRLAVFSKAGHWPSWYEMAFYYDLHLDWFHRYLGGGPAPWDPDKFLRNEVFATPQ
ncbi:MAG: prolyl oligopeptidase family serine peptidase [Acidobacteriota bacterium]